MNIIKSPSPNFGTRNGQEVSLLVIHCTEGYFPSDMGWLQNPESKVSAHYVVAPDGKIYNLVDEKNAAWHAGNIVNPTAMLKKDTKGAYISPNLYSIGIEVSLKPPKVMPESQKQALAELVSDIVNRYKLTAEQVVGHKEIRSNKTCPGTINVAEIKSLVFSPSIEEASKEVIKAQIIELVNKL